MRTSLLALAILPALACGTDKRADASDEPPDTSVDTSSPADTASPDETDTGDPEDTADTAAPPTSTWHPDADGDGFGDPGVAVEAEAAPAGHVADGTDCDDASPASYPGAAEVCEDGLDNGCEGDDDADCRLVGAFPLALADATLYGEQSWSDVGASFAVGDLDGDGRDDLVAASLSDRFGAVYTVTTLPAGLAPLDAHPAVRAGAQDEIPTGALAVLPDTDGDGEADLFVGAYTGDAWIVSGYDEEDRTPHAAPTVLLDVGATSVASLGDPDGDGLAAFAVGDPDFAGRVRVFAGQGVLEHTDAVATVALDVTGHADYLGGRLASCDLDADGVLDLLATVWPPDGGQGDAFGAGQVYALTGPLEGELRLADDAGTLLAAAARIQVPDVGTEAGLGLACGDLDGDGYADVVASAQSWADPGDVWVVGGPVTGALSFDAADASIVGTTASDGLGEGLAADGDLDGDGRDDLVVSDAEGLTSAAVFYGPLRGAYDPGLADAWLDGDGASTKVGGPIVAGDLDGDGFDDLALGNPYASRRSSYDGEVYVVLGGAL